MKQDADYKALKRIETLESYYKNALPGSFEDYWNSRNRTLCPFDSADRSEQSRHRMTWFSALVAARLFKQDFIAYKKVCDEENHTQ